MRSSARTFCTQLEDLMTIQRLLAAAAAVSLLAGAAYAQAPAAAPTAAAAKLAVNGDTMTTLRTATQFTTLVKAIDAANLGALFQDRTRSLTLFAPTDA